MNAIGKVAGFAKKAGRQMGWSAGKFILQKGDVGCACGSCGRRAVGLTIFKLMKRAGESIVNRLFSFIIFLNVIDLMRFASVRARSSMRSGDWRGTGEMAGGVYAGSAGWYINALVRMRILRQRIHLLLHTSPSDLIFSKKTRRRDALEVCL